MKKIMILLAVLLCAGAVIIAPASAKEKTKKTAKPAAEESVPLVTEVMTKEELQAYLKEKNIPVITKENFKEPELVWERTFENEYISNIGMISDITEKGNCIIISGRDDISSAERKLLFIDNKGNTRKEIALGKRESNPLAVAKSGKAAVSGKWNENEGILHLSYFNEEGGKAWEKKIELREIGNVIISDNGETLAVEEGNPRWSIGEWNAGDLNISRILFFDGRGNKLYEYKKFRNIGWGEFSGDGNYYAGLFWWQEDSKAWGKLIYIDVREGKIQWGKHYGGNYWKKGELFGEDKYLAISEKGSFIAAVNVQAAENTPPNRNVFEYMKVDLFSKSGDMIAQMPGSTTFEILEEGLFKGGIIRGWIDINKLKGIGITGAPPFFLKIIDIEAVDANTNTRYAKTHRILAINDKEILWEKELVKGRFRFTRRLDHVIGSQYVDENRRKLFIYRLFVASEK